MCKKEKLYILLKDYDYKKETDHLLGFDHPSLEIHKLLEWVAF